MLDVLPPEGGDELFANSNEPSSRRRARPVRPAVTSDVNSGAKHIPVGPRTVEMNWKLPARLRKPIRSQLRKERAKKKQREAVVQFKRKLITTRAISERVEKQEARRKVSLPKRRVMNRGAEHHTGDTYRDSRPSVRVSIPPYAGGVMRGGAAKSTPSSSPAPAPQRAPKPAQKMRRQVVQRPRVQQPQRAAGRAEGPMNLLQGERDVAINFGDTKKSASDSFDPELFVQVASQRVSWKGLRSFIKNHQKSANIGVLLVGFALVWVGVWNLQGVARGLGVLSAVQEKVFAAFDQTQGAQAALAAADFNGSNQAFSDAGALIGEARSQLDDALAASRYTLRILDVTNTVRSGQELLVVGEELTAAGQKISGALAGLLGEESDVDLVEAVEGAQANIAEARDHVINAESALAHVNSPLLPADAGQYIDQLKALLPTANAILTTLSEQSDTYLHLLGAEHDRQYLLLFANNDELRPIGGFIGTVGLVNVDRGSVENIDIQTVYDPDGQLQEFIAPPEPLSRITNRWFLRDTNWFVDYTKSAQKAAEFFEKEGGPTVDGVILLTPDVVKRLLAVTGPISVPNYDTTVSAENFVEITQGEVTYDYDKELNRPKQFLADLGPILLQRVFEGEADKLDVIEALTDAIAHKELLLYFTDQNAQEDLAELGWDGALPEDTNGFLHVNNANIGGHKSDQFVDQEIDYRTQIRADGDVDVVLTIRRTHNGPAEVGDYPYPEGENPSVKDNIVYQRVLVPRDAELLEASGFTSAADVPRFVIEDDSLPLEPDPDIAIWQRGTTHSSDTVIREENGYTSFGNWIVTQPGQTSVALYRYRLSRYASLPNAVDAADRYVMYVAKQPGSKRNSVRASLELPSGYKFTHTLPETGVTRQSDSQFVYRGELSQDIVIGAVFEPL